MRKLLRVLAVIFSIVLLLAIVGALLLRAFLHGDQLGEIVADRMSEKLQGHFVVESVDWPLSHFHTLLVGGWLPLTVENFDVYDGDKQRVLHVPEASLEIDTAGLLFGRNEILFRDVVVKSGAHALIRSVPNPKPKHEFDRRAISLLQSFQLNSPKELAAGLTAQKGPLVEFADFDVADAALDLDFGVFRATLAGVGGTGFLTLDGSDPIVPSLFYDLAATADVASILAPFELDLLDVAVPKLAQLSAQWPERDVPRDLKYLLTATTAEGGSVSANGSLNDFWLDPFLGEHELAIQLDNAEGLVEEATNGFVGGPEISGTISIEGTAMGPLITTQLNNIEVFPGPTHRDDSLVLKGETAKVILNVSEDKGHLPPFLLKGAKGTARLSANFGLYPTSLDVDLEIIKAFELAPWLPKELTALAGGSRLDGRVSASGDLLSQQLAPVSLVLGETTIRGTAEHKGTRLRSGSGFTVVRNKTTVSDVTGYLDWGTRSYSLSFGKLASNDASSFFREFDAPVFADTVKATGRIAGNFDDPSKTQGSAKLSLGGVPFLGQIDAKLGIKGATLKILEASSKLWQGAVRAEGALVLDKKPKLRNVQLVADDIRLSKVPNYGNDLDGILALDFTADGPLSNLRMSLESKMRELRIGDDRFDNASVVVNQSPKGKASFDIEMKRTGGGGAKLNGKRSRKGALQGLLSVSKMPLRTIFRGFGLTNLAAGGELNANMELFGSDRAPRVSGDASLVGGWIRSIFFGNASFNVESTKNGPWQISATLFQDKVSVDAIITPRFPFATKAEVSLRRVELDLLLPEAAENSGVRSWVSGDLTWNGDLMGNGPSNVVASLGEAVFVLDREDSEGRPDPVTVRNKTPINFNWDGKTLALTEPVIVASPLGNLEISGRGSEEKLEFLAKGDITLPLLRPYLSEYFQSMDGTTSIEASIGGSLQERQYTGSLEFSDVKVAPQGQDATVEIPQGKIQFNNDQLAITGMSIEVLDEFNHRSILEVAGGAALSNLVPTSWALTIEGKLAGKMLLVAFPQVFSAASGSADIAVSFLGQNATPELDGTIEFSPGSPLKLTPRGVRKEISLTNGRLEFSEQLAEFKDIKGWLDGEGEIVNLAGEVSFARIEELSSDAVKLESIDLTLVARDLPFRIPGELEAQINLPRLQILGGENQEFELIGRAEVVDGRYVRKWSPFLDAVRPERSSESEAPFYSEAPWLANAKLNLELDTRGFVVRNNVANIEMNGTLEITGTPKSPLFEGVVRVDQGSFKFQGVRANFTRTTGTITFSRFRQFPDDTPYLRISSESDFRDISGQDHVVTLDLEGSIANLDWNLSTNSGLTRGQTFTLIVAGRTTEETRKALGDEVVGGRPGNFTAVSTASEEGAFVAVDQVVKDLAGDFFSLLIEDPIRNFTSLDVARLEVGTASIGFRGEKNFTKSLRIIGEVDRSFLRGWSWDVRGEYRLTDSISLDGEVLQKNFDDDVQEDETNLRAKFSWRRVLLP